MAIKILTEEKTRVRLWIVAGRLEIVQRSLFELLAPQPIEIKVLAYDSNWEIEVACEKNGEAEKILRAEVQALLDNEERTILSEPQWAGG